MIEIPGHHFGSHWHRTLHLDEFGKLLTDRQLSFHNADAGREMAERLLAEGGRFGAPFERFELAAAERLPRGGWWGRVTYLGHTVTWLAFATDMRDAITLWHRFANFWHEPILRELDQWDSAERRLKLKHPMPCAPWGMWMDRYGEFRFGQGYRDPEEIYHWLWLLLARESGRCGEESWAAGQTPVIIPPKEQCALTWLGRDTATVRTYRVAETPVPPEWETLCLRLLKEETDLLPGGTLKTLCLRHELPRGEAYSFNIVHCDEEETGIISIEVALTEDGAECFWHYHERQLIVQPEIDPNFKPYERPPAPWVCVQDEPWMRLSFFTREEEEAMDALALWLPLVLLKIWRGEVAMPEFHRFWGWRRIPRHKYMDREEEKRLFGDDWPFPDEDEEDDDDELPGDEWKAG